MSDKEICLPLNSDENPQNWDPSDPKAIASVEVDLKNDSKFEHLDDETERKWHILREPAGST